MTPSDLFSVALRVFGVWVLWSALSAVLAMILGPVSFKLGTILWQVVMGFVGLWLLRGAPALQDYAYPPARVGEPSMPPTSPT